MAKFCKLVPDKGVNLFNNLKLKYGYDIAWKLTTLTTIPEFINGKSFRTDSEGFPLMNDLLLDSIVKKMLGEYNIMKGLEKNFKTLDNTRDNYMLLLLEANNFNNSTENKKYIALVEQKDDKLSVHVSLRNKDNEKEAVEQYATNLLNNRVAEILTPIGITISDLELVEQLAGRIGVTDFTKINRIADSCVNVIRVANNQEGARSVSEEFSHLIIGAYIDEPLIKRALNAIKNEEMLRIILGEEYDKVAKFQDNNIDLIAEEALGKLLRENLLAEVANNPEKISLLLNRLYDNIKSKFKNINVEDIQNAIIEANNLMGQLAKDILTNNLKLSREKIMAANRDTQFNALSERIDANIEILKKLKDVEIKRLKISSNLSADDIQDLKKRINELVLASKGDTDTRIGIFKYAKLAIEDLRDIENQLTNYTIAGHPSFAALLRARTYIQSYAGFIKDMQLAIINSSKDNEVPDFLTNIELEDGTIVDMLEIIGELNNLSDNLVLRYNQYAESMIIEFFRPMFGSAVEVLAGKNKGQTVTIELIVREAASDISFLDTFLDSMTDSSDTYLQLFGLAVKEANDKARHSTIRDSKEVLRLLLYAKEHNIDNFDWMFETYSNGKKNGNYISKLDYAKFEEERNAIRLHLNNKYGEVAKGEDAKKKIAEYKNWVEENCDPSDSSLPKDIEKYHNKKFMNLTSELRYFYNEFMKLKLKADSRLPDNRVQANKAIQMRKTYGNRIIESLSSPTTLISNIKENIKLTFLELSDDDLTFGNSKSGLTNFDGTEYMSLPVLYTNRLNNPEELSTDVLSSLLNYMYTTNVYEQMNEIVDPLEVARYWVTDHNRKVPKTVGGKTVSEKINVLGQKVVNRVYQGQSNIERKLNEFMESGVYLRYLKDEGTIGNTKISISKAGNWVLKKAAFALLGFNFLANAANVVNGLAMSNIEAAAGEYFSAKELADADSSYIGLLSEFLSELGSRNKTNKLSLFSEFFNIKADYDLHIKSNKMRNIFQKLFGENIAYLALNGGDHWLYNRIAIARCKAIKVLVPKVAKKTKKVRGVFAALRVLKDIINNSMQMALTDDLKFYKNNLVNGLYARVTSIIQSEGENNKFEEFHKDGSPNNWITPSTNIGTGIDTLVRDFFDNLLLKDSEGKWHHDTLGDDLLSIYPNMTLEDMNNFLEQLTALKNEFDSKNLKIVSKNIVARGKLTVNINGKLKDLNVAGTLDLLAYDDAGNFYIYDMKTHRGKITNQKKHKWSAQLSLYKKFLLEEYGINIKELNIIPIKVSYPTPKGETSNDIEGTAEYTVKEDTNQLLLDGKKFEGASPKLEEVISIAESKVAIDAKNLGNNNLALTKHNLGDYNEMSLWDALLVVNVYEDRDDIKLMIIPEGTTDIDGNSININKISREILDINIHLFGAYNQEDSNIANRVILGRALMQYRKWIKPSFNKRFQSAQLDALTGKTKEGYYRTFGKYYAAKFLANFANEALRGKIQIAEHWDELSDHEKANIKRAWMEMLQCLFVYLIATYAPFPDDKDRPWALKFAEYLAKREMHELGTLTPSLTMGSELLKTVKSPLPVLNTINSCLMLTHSILTPEDWVDEKQSGPYKGLSSLEANFLKAPIPILSQWRQIEKFGSEIDTSINYYARPY